MPVAYKVSETDRCTILRLHDSGLSDFQIAIQMGIYPSAVRWHIKRAEQGKQPRKLRKVAK